MPQGSPNLFFTLLLACHPHCCSRRQCKDNGWDLDAQLQCFFLWEGKPVGILRACRMQAQLVSQRQLVQRTRVWLQALPQAFPRAPTARLCSLKDLSKSLLQSHACFQHPYAASSQHKTPATLLNNTTSKVALRSNPTKTNEPFHSSNHRPPSGKAAGYGHKGGGHTAVAAKRDTPVSRTDRFPTHINKPRGHVFLVMPLTVSSAPEPPFSRCRTFSI